MVLCQQDLLYPYWPFLKSREHYIWQLKCSITPNSQQHYQWLHKQQFMIYKYSTAVYIDYILFLVTINIFTEGFVLLSYNYTLFSFRIIIYCYDCRFNQYVQEHSHYFYRSTANKPLLLLLLLLLLLSLSLSLSLSLLLSLLLLLLFIIISVS